MMRIGLGATLAAIFAALAVGSAAAAQNPEASATWFLGNWTCSGTVPANGGHPASTYHTPNRFALAPGSQWITNRWGPENPDGGIAYIGYVPGQKQWVYEDYHYDGSMARVTSPGLQDGKWIWSGPYYPAGGGVLHGRIVYVLRDKTRYDRIFEAPQGTGWHRLGGDTCTRPNAM